MRWGKAPTSKLQRSTKLQIVRKAARQKLPGLVLVCILDVDKWGRVGQAGGVKRRAARWGRARGRFELRTLPRAVALRGLGGLSVRPCLKVPTAQGPSRTGLQGRSATLRTIRRPKRVKVRAGGQPSRPADDRGQVGGTRIAGDGTGCQPACGRAACAPVAGRSVQSLGNQRSLGFVGFCQTIFLK